ncbi:hypothetical protein [Aquiflexum sp.]|uniref:hypothetical protein n=1 Tax=Aquiflexum sp. TaxID=1872584 RepID=UPI003593EBB6
MKCNHKVYTIVVNDYEIYQIKKHVPKLNFLEFCVKKRIDLVVDLTSQTNEFGSSIEKAKYLFGKKIHLASLSYVFDEIINESVANDEFAGEGVYLYESWVNSPYFQDFIVAMDKFNDYFDYIFNCKKMLKVLILTFDFELECKKELVSTVIRNRSDCDLIHVIPNLVSENSFHELNDSKLNTYFHQNNQTSIRDFAFTLLGKEDRKKIIEWRKYQEKKEDLRVRKEYEDDQLRPIENDFNREMNDETDGFWDVWIND